MKHIFRKVIFGTIAICFAMPSWAQDIIVTLDAKKIEAKILEVSKTEIKYKEKDNLNGPTFVLGTNEINSIIYENGKVVLYNQGNNSETKNEIKEQVSEKVADTSFNCEIYLLSGDTIRGKLMERANDYVAYTLNAKYYTIPASQIEYVKDLRNGEITKYEGSSRGKASGALQGDKSANQQVNSTPQYVSRNGNTYYFNGRTMNEESYSEFLKNNCPAAYDIFNTGSNTAFAGWMLFSLGVGTDLGSLIGYLIAGPTTVNTAFSIIGLGCEIACIPTLIVGYNKKHKSVDVYNSSCAYKSKSRAYWSINASQNGLGIALNF